MNQPIKAGDMAMLSVLFEAVGDLLTDAQRAELTAQLTSLSPAGVAPGDLITADMFNAMINNINDLLARVAVLEGAEGGPVIARIEPDGIDKPVGSGITIIGANFRPDDIDTRVLFGAIEVSDFFPQSDENQLVLPVPVGFTTLPANIPVSVKVGDRQSNQVTIRVVSQPVVITGGVVVRNQGTPLGQITVGQPFSVTWRVLSTLNVERAFNVSAAVSNVVGATTAAWIDAIDLSETGPFTLQSNQSRDIVMTFTVPAGATSVSLNLLAESTTDNFDAAGPRLDLVVGQTPAVSDPRAIVAIQTFAATDELRTGNILVEGRTVNGFRMRPSLTLALPMQISTRTDGGGFYRFTAEVEPGTPTGGGAPQNGRWTVGSVATAANVSGNTTFPVDVPMTSSATVDLATPSHIILRARCFANAAASTPLFTSFVRVPITGKS